MTTDSTPTETPANAAQDKELPIPSIIADAGDHAVEQYRAYFAKVLRTPGSRNFYHVYMRRFFHWAGERSLTLAAAVAAAEEHIRQFYAPESVSGIGTQSRVVLRSLFRHLAKTGVIATNPLETALSRKFAAAADRKPQPSIPIADLREAVAEVDETWEPDSEFFQAGLVLLSPISLGTMDPVSISRFTGVPLARVKEFAGRLLSNGCWTEDGKIAIDPDADVVSIILNVLVATGLAERQPCEATTEPASGNEVAEPSTRAESDAGNVSQGGSQGDSDG